MSVHVIQRSKAGGSEAEEQSEEKITRDRHEALFIKRFKDLITFMVHNSM